MGPGLGQGIHLRKGQRGFQLGMLPIPIRKHRDLGPQRLNVPALPFNILGGLGWGGTIQDVKIAT